MATVHRFEGIYLGGDKNRALIYVQAGAERAEIQSRPLASAIPVADAVAKDDVKRVEVPAGEAVWHGGRAFLTTKRELWVIDGECRIDWKFTLPGKPDNGERLLELVGFYEDKLVLIAQHGEGVGDTGRILTLDAATGRQLGFATVKGGFDVQAKLTLDAAHGTLFAVRNIEYRVYQLATGEVRWAAPIQGTATSAGASHGIVFATTSAGVGMPGRGDEGFELLAPDATSTAPGQFIPGENSAGRAYLPVRSGKGRFALAGCEVSRDSSALVWQAHVPQSITTAPVVRGQSVYFVAGNAVYRANTTDGAVCWKQTVALKPGETLTELVFADGELRASGPGVLVRVTERAEVPRQIFWFGPRPL